MDDSYSNSWQRALRAREKIRRHDYVDDHYVDYAIPALVAEIGYGPPTNGAPFWQASMDVLSYVLDGLVDQLCDETIVSDDDGQLELEFPLRLECLDDFPLFKVWADRYEIRSIFVKISNAARPISAQDINQILGGLVLAARGRFAFVISECGFDPSAALALKRLALQSQFLILPFRQEDLNRLCVARGQGRDEVMELLRQRQTELLVA